jgi:hypothetical protein
VWRPSFTESSAEAAGAGDRLNAGDAVVACMKVSETLPPSPTPTESPHAARVNTVMSAPSTGAARPTTCFCIASPPEQAVEPRYHADEFRAELKRDARHRGHEIVGDVA